MALTDHQRSQAPRLVLGVLAAAAAARPQAVASALAEAGRVSPGLEEHVAWAAAQQVGSLVLTVDPARRVSTCLTQGVRLRSQQHEKTMTTQEEDLFS